MKLYVSSVLDWPPDINGNNMKKVTKTNTEMLPEYDFRGAKRGKYATRYAQGTNLGMIEHHPA